MRPGDFHDDAGVNNQKLLGVLGISQEGDNSLSDLPVSMQSEESLFHQSLLKSMEELLTSEADMAAAAQVAMLSNCTGPTLNSGSFSQATMAPQIYGHGPLTNQLSQETIEMLAASHLQLLAQQQALVQQQARAQQQQQTLAQQHALAQQQALLSQRQPIASTNDGSAIYVTAQNASQLGLPGWAGHRVVALPGEMVKPMTVLYNLDLGQTSAIPAQSSSTSSLYHPQPIEMASADGLRTGTSRDCGAGTSREQLKVGKPTSSGQQHVRSGDSITSDDQHIRRHRGRPHHGPKSLRQGVYPPLEPFLTPRTITNTVKAAAPSWANADWDPKNVQSEPRLKAGTGVFLPTGTGVFLPPDDDKVVLQEQRKAFPAPLLARQAAPAAAAAPRTPVAKSSELISRTQQLEQSSQKQDLLDSELYGDLPASMLA